MKYSPSQVYIQESLVHSTIELSLEAVLHIARGTGVISVAIVDGLADYYKNRGGVGRFVVGLNETLKEFTVIGKDCHVITDELKHKYCLRRRYKTIINGLENLRSSGCNSSNNKSECQLKTQIEILEFRSKIEQVSKEIYKLELENIQVHKARRPDKGVYYGNSYKSQSDE